MGNDMYPTTTTGALDILSRHRPDNWSRQRRSGKASNKTNGNSNGKSDKTDQEGADTTSFTQKEAEVVC
jgi:hypothetical protein